MKKIYLLAILASLTFGAYAQSSTNCFVQIAFNSSQNLCFGDCNGTASSFPVGTGPYLYSWSNGATTQNLTGLCAMGYTLTVTDVGAGNATCVGNGSITCPALLVVSTSTSTNSATAIVSGGTFPYTYSWAPGGQTTMTATGLTTGTYTVYVTDQNGCTTSGTATISMTGITLDLLIENDLHVFPNPATDHVTIEFIAQTCSAATISILNVLGEIRRNSGDFCNVF